MWFRIKKDAFKETYDADSVYLVFPTENNSMKKFEIPKTIVNEWETVLSTDMKKLRAEMEDSARDFERSMADGMRAIERDVGETISTAKADVQSSAIPALEDDANQAANSAKPRPDDLDNSPGRNASSTPSSVVKGSDLHG